MSYADAMERWSGQPRSDAGVELTNEQLSAPTRAATFLTACHVPDTAKVNVRIAVRQGHAVGVTVTMNPSADEMVRCVEKAVRALTWPASPFLDSVSVWY